MSTIDVTTIGDRTPERDGRRNMAGIYAPVLAEHTVYDLPVTGALPPELDGRYVRNGPNPHADPGPGYHWFTGDGMVHGVRLRDGKAEWYRNRWIRSTSISEALGEHPILGERYGGMETANTNVIAIAGRTFAIAEAGARPVEMTDELDSVRTSDFDGTLPYGFTAHPKRHPGTGELHAVNYHWARPGLLDYLVVGCDGRVRHHAEISVTGSPMVHDCSITDTQLALYDLPVTFSLDAVRAGSQFPYEWDADHGARVGVMPLLGNATEVQWFEVEPCFVFHPMNAYDDGDTVVLDVIRHDHMFDRRRGDAAQSGPALWRWRLDRATGRATEEQLDDRAVEFPRVDERSVGRPYRYGWASSISACDTQGGQVQTDDALVRYDTLTGAATAYHFGPGQVVGEAVFVPRDQEAADDDGWYLTFVYDRATDRSDLAVLSAHDPDAGPVARVQLPTRVPGGFHGNWIPAS